ncbi:hypothetical protein BDV25DRAFT_139206 [Aspergillus avenaceus]|uniref:Fe2OG dioxygenase domain-containing protein n=1 Tax=Aspergillus avenaceus TaxID=36643 RepID=A0A5N6TY81_ASPAV|nr:hypothetical protein BDV25DRAFT_139206 [Aspergillus avenaceus]
MSTVLSQKHEQLLHDELGDTFDPNIHLNYTPPSALLTMGDLGLGANSTTPIAGSVPFPFLSEEGVCAYRRAMIQPEILSRCAQPYGTGTFILRNLAKHSRFIRDLWTHPETNRIISEVAGAPLTIIMSTEIGHTNIQSAGHTVDDLIRELKVEPRRAPANVVEYEDSDPLHDRPVIPWHYDSYPYVAVVMLSDTTHMIGGETLIKKGDGSAVKVEGPALGYCVVLQGGQVEHLAARASGTTERITTITSYRAAVDGIYDNSYISNVRPYSCLPDLYIEWISYRLEKMKAEIQNMQAKIARLPNSDSASIPLHEMCEFTDQQVAYLTRTVRQMVDPFLCADVRRRFDVRKVNSVGRTWAHIRTQAQFKDLLPAVMALTMEWKPFQLYIADWHYTQHMITSGLSSSICSQQGNFAWCRDRANDFLFGDELLRQGLKEVLLAWLDWSDLLCLDQTHGCGDKSG